MPLWMLWIRSISEPYSSKTLFLSMYVYKYVYLHACLIVHVSYLCMQVGLHAWMYLKCICAMSMCTIYVCIHYS